MAKQVLNEQQRAAAKLDKVYQEFREAFNDLDVRINTGLLERAVLKSSMDLLREVISEMSQRAERSVRDA